MDANLCREADAISCRDLSDGDLREFRRLFRGWLSQGLNAEALQSGGEGKLEDLARSSAEWAKLLGLWPAR